MFYDRFIQLCNEKSKKPTAVATEMGINRTTPSKWKTNGFVPKQEILNKIATYFDVTTDYLLGNTDERRPINKDVTDDDIKFALWGGADGEITDEMYEDVKRYAQFIKGKYQNKD